MTLERGCCKVAVSSMRLDQVKRLEITCLNSVYFIHVGPGVRDIQCIFSQKIEPQWAILIPFLPKGYLRDNLHFCCSSHVVEQSEVTF